LGSTFFLHLCYRLAIDEPQTDQMRKTCAEVVYWIASVETVVRLIITYATLGLSIAVE